MISLKHRKLRGYVLPTLYVVVLIVIFGAVSLVSSLLQVNPNYLYSVNVLKDVSTSVVEEVETSKQIVRPYTSSDVKIATYFYDVDATPEEQHGDSLISSVLTSIPLSCLIQQERMFVR